MNAEIQDGKQQVAHLKEYIKMIDGKLIEEVEERTRLQKRNQTLEECCAEWCGLSERQLERIEELKKELEELKKEVAELKEENKDLHEGYLEMERDANYQASAEGRKEVYRLIYEEVEEEFKKELEAVKKELLRTTYWVDYYRDEWRDMGRDPIDDLVVGWGEEQEDKD